MKIAICISGLLKKYADGIDNLIQKVLLPNRHHQIDLYFHVWDMLDTRFINLYDDINVSEKDVNNITRQIGSSTIIKSFKIEALKSFNIDDYMLKS